MFEVSLLRVDMGNPGSYRLTLKGDSIRRNREPRKTSDGSIEKGGEEPIANSDHHKLN